MNMLWLIACGGALGAVARYLLSNGVHRLLGVSFPYGTLTVNVVGSFIIGLLALLFLERLQLGPAWRGFFIVGFLGAFTTFSSFSYETLMLYNNGMLALAALNILLNVVLCLAAVFAGVLLARII